MCNVKINILHKNNKEKQFMKNIFKTLTIGSAILSFTACTMVGQLEKPKTFAAGMVSQDNLNQEILVNSATELGYQLMSKTPKASTFSKDSGSMTEQIFGFDNNSTIQVSKKKDGVHFDIVETSNTDDKIDYKSVKKDLKDFVTNYQKDLKTEK
jgi:predicted small lipoprotein YifL